jgi:signal transduction histidine kinase
VIALASALTYRSASKDHDHLVTTFAEDRLTRLRDGIRDVEGDLTDIEQHLEITARHLASAIAPDVEKQQLDAVLAVAKAFALMAIYDDAGRQRVARFYRATPPSFGGATFEAELARTAREAISRRAITLSPPLGSAEAPGYRALAAPFRRDGRTEAVVLLVNLRHQLDHLRAAVGGASATFVLVDGDAPPWMLEGEPHESSYAPRESDLAELLRRMRAGETGTAMFVDPSLTTLGLTTADGVATFAPISTGVGRPWEIAVISSTKRLRAQERAIFLRALALGGTVLLAVLALATFFVVTAQQRTIAIREQLRSAEQLAHHREKAEKILEHVPVGVIALDAGGRVSAMNYTARARVPPSALGQPVEGAFPAAPAEAIAELKDLLASAGSSGLVHDIVAEPLALLGLGTYFAVHAVPLAHTAEDLKTLLVFNDVTELRAMASHLLRAEKLATVGVLAAGFAHEVGTPLGVMRGRAEMLASRLSPDAHEARSAGIIVEEIDRISRTIRELLDFSRTSRTPAATSARLDGVASQVAELLAFEARSRKVAIQVEVHERMPPLAANLDQLQQVLLNIMMNALHACGPGGQVTLRGRTDSDSGAVIEVVDDGAGIPQDLLHRVFDPFFTTKKRGKGTGLGLTVAAQIVRNHGGEIDLDSAVGRGTRVVLRWPLASAAMEPTG